MISIIRRSHNLRNQVCLLEETLEEQEVTPHLRIKLYRRLEKTCKKVECVRKNANSDGEFAEAQVTVDLKEVEEKIVHLYGRIDSLSVAYEITRVKKEIEDLEACLNAESSVRICQAVDSLKTHIFLLCSCHALSREDLPLIARAKQLLKNVECALNGTISFEQARLASVKRAFQEEFLEKDEDDSEVMELFEVADLFYHHHTAEALGRFHRLPKKFQAEVRLMADPEKDCFKTIQALIAIAHELSYGERHLLSQEEIHTLFAELNEIRKESHTS